MKQAKLLKKRVISYVIKKYGSFFMLWFVFLFGGFGYCLLELIWRGYTHPTMAVLGGVCLVAIVFINNRLFNRSRVLRAFLSAVFITLAEFLSGILINIVFKLNVWDYSSMPLNIWGQICPVFSLMWFALSYIVIMVLEKQQKKECK